MNAAGQWVMTKGCRELEECKGVSFSSWWIDGPHILMGGGRHLLHREMLPNKGVGGVFSTWGLCFSRTKAFVKSFITVDSLNQDKMGTNPPWWCVVSKNCVEYMEVSFQLARGAAPQPCRSSCSSMHPEPQTLQHVIDSYLILVFFKRMHLKRQILLQVWSQFTQYSLSVGVPLKLVQLL